MMWLLQQKLDAEFQKRLERNKIAAEEQTAKLAGKSGEELCGIP